MRNWQKFKKKYFPGSKVAGNHDWLYNLIAFLAILILFLSTYKSDGLKPAILLVATVFAFPISFAIPNCIREIKNHKLELQTILILSSYILSLLIIIVIAEDWRSVLFFPSLSFIWWFTGWVYKKLKLQIAKIAKRKKHR